MIFLRTPFEGSDNAEWANTASRYSSWISLTNNEKAKDLEERSAKLVGINEAFLKFLKARDRSKTPIEVACYFEEYPIYVADGGFGVIVSKKSAVFPGIDSLSIPANHIDICKFKDEDRNGFRNILEKLS
jgi:protein SERAC1